MWHRGSVSLAPWPERRSHTGYPIFLLFSHYCYLFIYSLIESLSVQWGINEASHTWFDKYLWSGKNISSQIRALQMCASLVFLFIPTCIHHRPPVLAERSLGIPPNDCGSSWMHASAVCGSMTGRSGHWEKMQTYRMIDRRRRKRLDASPPRVTARGSELIQAACVTRF